LTTRVASIGHKGALRSASRGYPTARVQGLCVLGAGAVALLLYLAMAVPVSAPTLPGSEAARHWPAALAAVLLVAALDGIAVMALRRRRADADEFRAPAPAVETRSVMERIPAPLRLQRVPASFVAIAVGASGVLLTAGLASGYPAWGDALLVLAPWSLLLSVELNWKAEQYGIFAFFIAIVVLQVGHMGEHTIQVSQLAANDGRLANAHGVFGQLDFETVHFFWDTAIWLSLAVLLISFGRGNVWMWVAFAAASLHEVEHVYLYWLYQSHPGFYMHGGFEGILGSGGVIGSPLARPYLHFGYNLMVTVPMALALWDESKRVKGGPARP
jgi:hypothetical protein